MNFNIIKVLRLVNLLCDVKCEYRVIGIWGIRNVDFDVMPGTVISFVYQSNSSYLKHQEVWILCIPFQESVLARAFCLKIALKIPKQWKKSFLNFSTNMSWKYILVVSCPSIYAIYYKYCWCVTKETFNLKNQWYILTHGLSTRSNCLDNIDRIQRNTENK